MENIKITNSEILTTILENANNLNTEQEMSPFRYILDNFKSNHYWPAIQLKKFFNNSNMLLIHNTYKKTHEEIANFKELYEECKTIILDFTRESPNSCIIYKSDPIPIRGNIIDYMSDDIGVIQKHNHPRDVNYPITVSYEGTMVIVYFNDGDWYFSTASCPQINNSKFVNPQKSHGDMLDEILCSLFDIEYNKTASTEARNKFTQNLDSQKVYEFIIVHHQNSKYIDYSSEFGKDYKKLIHIGTQMTINSSLYNVFKFEELLSNIEGIVYPKKFENVEEAVKYINANANIHGISFKAIANEKASVPVKLSKKEIIDQEEKNYGNSNVWKNILWTYIQKNPDYHIKNYIEDYKTNDGDTKAFEMMKDCNGNILDPTYVIHTIICNMRDILYNSYLETTNYFPEYNTFKSNKELYADMPSIMKFHIVQLRLMQTGILSGKTLAPENVYSYICKQNNMKNIIALISFFSEALRPNYENRNKNKNLIYEINPRISYIFGQLDKALKNELVE
jgi:hypothetical protein